MDIKFTRHAEDQMKERGISKDDVISTVKYPDVTKKEDDRCLARKKFPQYILEVVYVIENYKNVITVYPI
jgi:hypothetical protein